MVIILVWIITAIIFGALLLVIFTPLLYGVVYVVSFVGLWMASLFVDKRTSKKKKQKAKVREVKEDQELETIKRQFGWTDKYGDSYVSSKIGKVLWVEGSRWKLFNDNEITGYSVIERKHSETTYNGLEGTTVDGVIGEPIGTSTGFRLGDTIEKMGVIFTTSNGASYEILEFEGNSKASEMESDINRHNNLIRNFDKLVNRTSH